MELGKIRDFFLQTQRALILIGILLILLGVAFWALFVRPNPKYGKLPRPEIVGLTSGKPEWVTTNLNFGLNFRAPVAKVTKRKFQVKDAFTLAKKVGLNFAPDFLEGNTLKWKNSNGQLFVNLNSGVINYKDFVAMTNLDPSPSVARNQAQKLAIDFLKTNGLDSGLIAYQLASFEFLASRKTSDHIVAAPESGANLVVISFPLLLDGKPIISTKGAEAVKIMVNNKSQLAGLEFDYLDAEDQGATYPLISTAEAKKLVGAGKAKVARYLNEDFAPVTNPLAISLGQGKLRFFNDLKSDYLEPVYVFTGVVSRVLVNEPVEIYLPAVSENFLK